MLGISAAFSPSVGLFLRTYGALMFSFFLPPPSLPVKFCFVLLCLWVARASNCYGSETFDILPAEEIFGSTGFGSIQLNNITLYSVRLLSIRFGPVRIDSVRFRRIRFR